MSKCVRFIKGSKLSLGHLLCQLCHMFRSQFLKIFFLKFFKIFPIFLKISIQAVCCSPHLYQSRLVSTGCFSWKLWRFSWWSWSIYQNRYDHLFQSIWKRLVLLVNDKHSKNCECCPLTRALSLFIERSPWMLSLSLRLMFSIVSKNGWVGWFGWVGGWVEVRQVMSFPHSGHISQCKGHKYLIRVRYGSVFQHVNNVLSQLISDKVTYWTVWGQLKLISSSSLPILSW